ncbi:adenosine receptor A2a-like [Amphiura filiformis]|uniref:adenosine receptor A2a-like n=1 Tax=Amphiura filiformis TaxID=82378 RepID=UPI003B213FDA
MAGFDIFLFYGISSLVISSFTIVGNGLILFAFFQERSLRDNPSNNFIIALSLNDLFYGVINFIFIGIPYTFIDGYPYGEIGCMMYASLNHIFVVGNLLLLAISVDRVLLVAIKYPRYPKFQTSSRVGIAIAMCCITGLLLAIGELSLWNYAKKVDHIAAVLNYKQYCLSPPRRLREFGLVLSFGFYLFPISAIFILNGLFFSFLIRKIKGHFKVGNSSIQSEVDAMRRNQMQAASNHEEDGSSSTKNRYIKPAITLGVLVGAMAISNIPYCTYIIVVAFCETCKNPTMVGIYALNSQLNALLDPLFYALTQRKIGNFYRKKARRFWDWARDLFR